MPTEIKINAPLVIKSDTERIWITGRVFKLEQEIDGDYTTDASSISMLGAAYFLNLLVGPDKLPVTDETWIGYCQRDRDYPRPTHLLLADSLPYAYLLLLAPPSEGEKPTAKLSYFCRVTGFDSLRAFAAMGNIKPIVFGRLAKPGGICEYKTQYAALITASNQDGGIVVARTSLPATPESSPAH